MAGRDLTDRKVIASMWSPDKQDQEFFYQAKLQKYTVENESERSIYLEEDRFKDEEGDEDEEDILDDGEVSSIRGSERDFDVNTPNERKSVIYHKKIVSCLKNGPDNLMPPMRLSSYIMKRQATPQVKFLRFYDSASLLESKNKADTAKNFYSIKIPGPSPNTPNKLRDNRTINKYFEQDEKYNEDFLPEAFFLLNIVSKGGRVDFSRSMMKFLETKSIKAHHLDKINLIKRMWYRYLIRKKIKIRKIVLIQSFWRTYQLRAGLYETIKQYLISKEVVTHFDNLNYLFLKRNFDLFVRNVRGSDYEEYEENEQNEENDEYSRNDDFNSPSEAKVHKSQQEECVNCKFFIKKIFQYEEEIKSHEKANFERIERINDNFSTIKNSEFFIEGKEKTFSNLKIDHNHDENSKLSITIIANKEEIPFECSLNKHFEILADPLYIKKTQIETINKYVEDKIKSFEALRLEDFNIMRKQISSLKFIKNDNVNISATYSREKVFGNIMEDFNHLSFSLEKINSDDKKKQFDKFDIESFNINITKTYEKIKQNLLTKCEDVQIFNAYTITELDRKMLKKLDDWKIKTEIELDKLYEKVYNKSDNLKANLYTKIVGGFKNKKHLANLKNHFSKWKNSTSQYEVRKKLNYTTSLLNISKILKNCNKNFVYYNLIEKLNVIRNNCIKREKLAKAYEKLNAANKFRRIVGFNKWRYLALKKVHLEKIIAEKIKNIFNLNGRLDKEAAFRRYEKTVKFMKEEEKLKNMNKHFGVNILSKLFGSSEKQRRNKCFLNWKSNSKSMKINEKLEKELEDKAKKLIFEESKQDEIECVGKAKVFNKNDQSKQFEIQCAGKAKVFNKTEESKQVLIECFGQPKLFNKNDIIKQNSFELIVVCPEHIEKYSSSLKSRAFTIEAKTLKFKAINVSLERKILVRSYRQSNNLLKITNKFLLKEPFKKFKNLLLKESNSLNTSTMSSDIRKKRVVPKIVIQKKKANKDKPNEEAVPKQLKAKILTRRELKTESDFTESYTYSQQSERKLVEVLNKSLQFTAQTHKIKIPLINVNSSNTRYLNNIDDDFGFKDQFEEILSKEELLKYTAFSKNYIDLVSNKLINLFIPHAKQAREILIQTLKETVKRMILFNVLVTKRMNEPQENLKDKLFKWKKQTEEEKVSSKVKESNRTIEEVMIEYKQRKKQNSRTKEKRLKELLFKKERESVALYFHKYKSNVKKLHLKEGTRSLANKLKILIENNESPSETILFTPAGAGNGLKNNLLTTWRDTLEVTNTARTEYLMTDPGFIVANQTDQPPTPLGKDTHQNFLSCRVVNNANYTKKSKYHGKGLSNANDQINDTDYFTINTNNYYESCFTEEIDGYDDLTIGYVIKIQNAWRNYRMRHYLSSYSYWLRILHTLYYEMEEKNKILMKRSLVKWRKVQLSESLASASNAIKLAFAKKIEEKRKVTEKKEIEQSD